jgi:hypothetical protein
VGVAPTPVPSLPASDAAAAGARAGCTTCVVRLPGLPATGSYDASRIRPYSPWASLLPRYWMPVLESTTEDGTSFGAATSGFDVIGRHDYTVEGLHNTRLGQNSAWLWYRYAGLGRPLLDFYSSQNYSNATLFGINGPDTSDVGVFAERERIASLQATITRPRFRSYGVVSFGAQLQNLSYSTSPDTLLGHLPLFYATGRNYPALVVSAGWSNAQRPTLSISPEDGVSLSVSGRQRWQRGSGGKPTRSVVGVSSAFKSLDLPGFAHHVLALRGAVGVTDERSPNRFSAGGISGTELEVFPGFAIGEQRRTFGVRGYPVGAEGGIRAYTATAEYRLPLAAPSRGFRFIPVFVDKTSLSLFGETGRAFCPSDATGTGVCRSQDIGAPQMTSMGAELNIDSSVQLDFNARFRLGIAVPLANRSALGARAAQLYGTVGASF